VVTLFTFKLTFTVSDARPLNGFTCFLSNGDVFLNGSNGLDIITRRCDLLRGKN